VRTAGRAIRLSGYVGLERSQGSGPRGSCTV
jgi:hypothetical protein